MRRREWSVAKIGFSVGLLLASGCSALSARAWAAGGRGGPAIVAHRGASAYAPENTLAAFREAIERGAKIAECDVHLSADGELIVMHDPSVERTTDGQGRIVDLGLEEISHLDAGSWMAPRFTGEPVPTLSQLLDFVRNRLVLFIEVKSGPETIEALAALLRPRRVQRNQLAVIAFDPEVVARSEARMPDIPTMLLVWVERSESHPPPEALAKAVELGAEMIGLPPWAVDRATIRAAHDARIGVFVYTVNDAFNVVRVLELGVDGIHTDAPDFVKEVIEAAPI